MTDHKFYRAFEDRYRGSRDIIKSRLNAYLPFILPLQSVFGSCNGVDLGCGRGEWLELMQENGIDVRGIDVDQGMLEAARERNLNVSYGDAIQYLQSLASESQVLVSGFHIAEHLPFDLLQEVVQESLRVLKPGGLLILETPNPENILVGTTNFYLDPSHQRPIPPLLLSFMVEHYGFERVKTLRLQEPIGLTGNASLNLMNVFVGVSQDYAIAAQKGGNSLALNVTAPAFDLDYGLALDTVTSSYDSQVKSAVRQVETIALRAENKAHNAEVKANYAENKANSAEHRAHLAEIKIAETEARIISLLESTSWKITAPIRLISRIASRILNKLRSVKLKSTKRIELLLAHTKLYITLRPRLTRFVLALVSMSPTLKNRLKHATTLPVHSDAKSPHLENESCSILQASLTREATRWPLGRRIDAPK